jgi:small subunit ribosomal protein S16
MGTKNKPVYRVVVADSRSPRDGKFIEMIGNYYPLREENSFHVDEERVKWWMERGAKPTETVKQLLIKNGIIKRKG